MTIKETKPVVNLKDLNIEQNVNPEPMFFTDIFGTLKVVDTAPTAVPRSVAEQIVLYSNGATVRLYVYDNTNGWVYKTFDNT